MFCLQVFVSHGQLQTCPDNISFSNGTLTHWSAYTGNNRLGNGADAIQKRYPSSSSFPSGTIGAVLITEYNLSRAGIQVINTNSNDPFGGFSTIPNINGYRYTNSVLLGSTAVSTGSFMGGPQGGYVRGVSYDILVPAGETTEPYTMTYAYAMVLENGTHNSNEQPLFSATLEIHDSIIACASPKYYLPTLNNAARGGRGATLDTAAALAEGFSLSPLLSPNEVIVLQGQGPVRSKDVWTKGWTEVTFDLSPYRGQHVTLTFEADNCIPGGHFAYAYVALRNNCAGLAISGPVVACTNTPATYSIPALGGATYHWTVPADWTITSSTDTSMIHVVAGSQSGYVIAHEINGCANLMDTIQVTTSPPTIAGQVDGDTTVCAGININPMLLTGNRGNVLKWISSVDGSNWSDISNASPRYTATNLSYTTAYRAVVQNGASCNIDTSGAATITVDQKSLAAKISPEHTDFCQGQNPVALLTEQGNTGQVINWQSSLNAVSWNDVAPAWADSVYQTYPVLQTTQFRTIVKNGVCAADTSGPAEVQIYQSHFPEAAYRPADTTICYNGVATLDASISIGTSYTWNISNGLSNPGDGNVSSWPFGIHTTTSPRQTTDYVLMIKNQDCPNLLLDTFHVQVLAPIVVNAGNDTSVVINQPLQFNAASSENGDQFTWSPAIALSDALIPNPIGLYDGEIDNIKYTVTATNAIGCTGSDDITVKVFKTGPDIFVPNAFTPGKNINAIFRPIPVGVASLQYFRIFNRWGQLVYSTSRVGDGWDGNLNGQPQSEGSFVWMVQGTSYTGKTITKKGVMTLIR